MDRKSMGQGLLNLGLLLGLLPSAMARGGDVCKNLDYQVGAAQDDITGPIVELGMMGYADIGQVDEGLHMRLRSRAMVISDGCGGNTVAMVIGDLGQVFHGLKQAVVDRLDQRLPGVFQHRNLLFSATHTHSGPGGFAHHALYNITTLGFNAKNFEAIVHGTVNSIVKAYQQRQPARLTIDEGQLQGVQYNRSSEAYAANPQAEQARYAGDSDPSMIQLKALAMNGKPLASFNWYALHGVSLPLENTYISGDNKGLASYKFEKKMGATYLQDQEFIAGFVQSNSGDISPYDVSGPLPAKGFDAYPRNEQAADAQFNKAWELFNKANEAITGPLSVVHSFVDVAHFPVLDQFTHQGPQTTCMGALGVSFAAGTENGRPVDIFHEGTVYGINWPTITLMPEEQDCQKEKVILLPTGAVKPDPWTAQVAPFQLLRIGQLLVVAVPFEFTTMAGRRLKEGLLKTMAPAGIKYVAIAALANEYMHYVTTREEYAMQSYEGASTLFGPWSLAAYTQVLQGMASSLRDGKPVAAGSPPPDLSGKQVVLKPGVIFDSTPIGKAFGETKLQPKPRYETGEKVTAEFWAAHPTNSLGLEKSHLTVDQLVDGVWKTVRYDWDADTFYHWQRHGIANSLVTIIWETGPETPLGIYRLCQIGHSKPFLIGKLKPYMGCTRSFELGLSPAST